MSLLFIFSIFSLSLRRSQLNVVVGDKMPSVMGKKGIIIKKIVSESGATIDRLPDENVLVLRGFAEQVTAAKALIELYMAGGPPPEAREEVELGSERGRFIVLGPKGQTIRTIQDDTGAKV
jgi:polyribonucleotide nucleotidyltransferase